MTPDNTEPRTADEQIEEAMRLLRLLFTPDDWIELRMPSGGSRWFKLADDARTRATLRRAIAINARQTRPLHVWFGANPRARDGASKAGDVPLARALFADFDKTMPDVALECIRRAGLPEPTAVVMSGGGTHAYWLLTEPIADMAAWTATMKAIIAAVGSDHAVHDAPRVMRLPGTRNVKPEYSGSPMCRIVSLNDSRHQIAAFPSKALQHRKTYTPSDALPRPLCDEGERFMQSCDLAGERRPALFRIACDMNARGWTLGQAMDAIMARVGKIPRPLTAEEAADVPRQIESAFSKPRERGHIASPAQKAASALVADAAAGDAFGGGTDLTRPITWGDIGLSRRLARTVRGRLAYIRERRMWFAFDGKRWAERADHIAVQECKRLHDELWREVGEVPGESRKAAVEYVQSTATKRCIDAVVALARSEPGINVSQADFDAHPWLLNVENGVLDLRSGDLHPHNPQLRLMQLAPVSYDPDAKSELWERFIRDVTCGDEEIANFMQQAFGLALTGDVSDEVLICHNGGGCNGKSTALEAIAAMLGDYAAVAPPGLFTARNFDSHPTEIAVLHGKRFVTAIEQEANRALREALVKSLTGGDTIRTRRMREDFWEMKPTWHIHIAYNRAPRLSGTDDGIRRRLRVVPWAASFKDRPDLTVKQRLVGTTERSGILSWCLEGLRRRLLAGRLESPSAVLVATDEYIEDEDLVGRFIADCCIEGPREEVEIRETLAAFKRWMQADGTPRHVCDSFTANMLGRELARRGFNKRRPDAGPFRKRTVYAGLRLAQDSQFAHAADEWSDPFGA